MLLVRQLYYDEMKERKKTVSLPSLINRRLCEVEDQWHSYIMYGERPRAAGHFHSHYYIDSISIILLLLQR